MTYTCNTLKLIEAMLIIKKMYSEDSEVTAIQFEDGSGTRFNYQINNQKWEYIDLAVKFKYPR